MPFVACLSSRWSVSVRPSVYLSLSSCFVQHDHGPWSPIAVWSDFKVQPCLLHHRQWLLILILVNTSIFFVPGMLMMSSHKDKLNCCSVYCLSFQWAISIKSLLKPRHFCFIKSHYYNCLKIIAYSHLLIWHSIVGQRSLCCRKAFVGGV